jgi:hypothetical protein
VVQEVEENVLFGAYVRWSSYLRVSRNLSHCTDQLFMERLAQLIYNAYYAVPQPSIFLVLYGLNVINFNQRPYSAASPKPNIFIEFFQALPEC